MTLKHPALVNHLEIIAMVTKHFSLKMGLWSASRLGLEVQVIAGYRPQEPGFVMCYLAAGEWLPVERKIDSIEIEEKETKHTRMLTKDELQSDSLKRLLELVSTLSCCDLPVSQSMECT